MSFDLAPGPRPQPPPPPPTAPTTTAAHPTPPPTPTASAIATAHATATPTATATATPTAIAPAGSATPDTRSTSFQAVSDEPESHSGEGLLVSAYSVLWLILMGWLVLVWKKQASLNVRLDGLERAIDRAVAKTEKAAAGAKKTSEA